MPLAVDAQVRVPFGPVLLPLRALLLIALVSPLAITVFGLDVIPVSMRLGISISLLMLAFTCAAPTREGVWLGTWFLYGWSRTIMPTVLVTGRARRARVRHVMGAARITAVQGTLHGGRHLRSWTQLLDTPRIDAADSGIVRLSNGDAHAVLMLEAYAGALGSTDHAQWCRRLLDWLSTAECPVQLLSISDHQDSRRAQLAFDARTAGSPRTPLLEMERALAGRVAEQSLGMEHWVVLSPGQAGRDGIPHRSRITRWRRRASPGADVDQVLKAAVRLAAAAGIGVTVPDRDDLAGLLSRTLLGATSAAVDETGAVQIGDQQHIVLTATRLPSMLHHGAVVEALMRSRCCAAAALTLAPVATEVARRALDRRMAMQRYVAREGNDDIDNRVALADAADLSARMAQRDVRPCRVALTMSVNAQAREDACAAAERLGAALRSQGFDVAQPTRPGFLPILAMTPGGAPLGRSLQLTTEDVAACLVPVLGTPYSDVREPLVGLSEVTGAPVYLSLWKRTNHNALIVGSSGAGKSVAVKSLLIRHLQQGATAVVIDPDSEYRRVMQAVGGVHLELGDDALNPLAPAAWEPADAAAALVLPVLSVMAGDERGVRDGRPVRRLPDEDQGWLYGEVAAFFRRWSGQRSSQAPEPLLRNLIEFIHTQSAQRALTRRQVDRCRVITSRLQRFIQGDRAAVFDRPSTFRVGERPVAIGLARFTMAYAADLTPALAVVLTGVLGELRRLPRRLIVVVDEAHRVTVDPDAGEVLGQLVRRARKHGAGVWMCSQRIEDFVASDLGKTLAATAATKLVMGAEEASLADLRTVFSLRDEEIAAVHPTLQGCGVLLSGAERSVVRILPGPAILALAETRPPLPAGEGIGAAARA